MSTSDRALHAATPHDSAVAHVTGAARFIDDLPEPRGLLHAFIRLSDRARARVVRLDTAPAAAAPGVAAVLSARDLAHATDIGPVFPGDPVFAGETVEYDGQSILAVAAETLEQARAAAGLAVVELEDLPAILTVEEALAAGSFVLPSQVMRRGDAAAALAEAPHRLRGRLVIGGQEHFYLEGQVALALPGDDGGMHVLSSTQAPTEVQHLVAKVLGLSDAAVVVETRRMGGGFGGKETQAALPACVAALLAARTGRPVKLRLDRDDDMRLTGKRHDFVASWEVGFDAEGVVRALDLTLASRCGVSPDLSGAVNDRAMMHADNAYFLPHVTVTSHRCRTNTASSTAFRGFGGPQGMMAVEAVMDEVARSLGKDPLEVRRTNLYGGPGRDTTPYGMAVEPGLRELVDGLAEQAGYAARREEVARFNAGSRWVKRGLALTPVKFGISFTSTFLNQAGALLHLYTDGSALLSHGGTEMGQGLYVKVAQVVAEELGLPLERVRLASTRTDKVPNTSPTAASSGSDLNGAAARAAARTLRERLAEVAAPRLGCPAAEVAFEGGELRGGGRALPFAEVARAAHAARVSLSATGYYRTPEIYWDAAAYQGRPFFYFACGAAVAEVEVNALTGEHRLRRVDLVHDVGRSLNPAIDRGQVEGAFVQGAGWLTSEELWYDAAGRLGTHAPSTYKIPTCSDVPEDFRVTLLERPNREATVHRSKAVGEPPLMLAISVFHALRDAVAAAGRPRALPPLDAPATAERVLLAMEAVRGDEGGAEDEARVAGPAGRRRACAGGRRRW